MGLGFWLEFLKVHGPRVLAGIFKKSIDLRFWLEFLVDGPGFLAGIFKESIASELIPLFIVQ